jgi:hypothetical protein
VNGSITISLFGNNEDLPVARAALTRDGVHFTDLALYRDILTVTLHPSES